MQLRFACRRFACRRFVRSGMAIASSVALAALAGCGSSSSSSSSTATSAAAPAATTAAAAASGVKVSTATVSGLGTVLVDSKGHTLYIFEPDKKSKVTCVGSCAAIWPPLKVTAAGGTAQASGEVKAPLLSTAPDPEGGSVVTYAGWPLYDYVADSSAGSATGQGLNNSGGLWYVISPAGQVITKAP